MIFQLLRQQGWTLPVMYKKICYTLTIIISLFAASANGAPMAYSVNSDSVDGDSLYLIDLASGVDQLRGELFNGIEIRSDTEGLAFAPDGTLWGIDDNSRTLFPINPVSGSINYKNEIFYPGFPAGGSNDFGITFSCDNTLYATSVITRTLYKLDLQGNTEVIGSPGALNANISAIAAIGNPTRLYGLGNGDVGSPGLYSIDIDTGVATTIGPLGAVGEYSEGGMAFDSSGVLWAITDRSLIDSASSEILRIDVITGAATVVSSTTEIGFESLAIGPPSDCVTHSRDETDDGVERIPSLSPAGRLLAIFVLMFAGMAILRRHHS